MSDIFTLTKEIFEQTPFDGTPHELYAPIAYTMRLGGKRLRPTLLIAANQMFGGDIEQVRHAAIGIEMYHNFTLLHDDLMDRSPLRRGQPTVYRKWNENTAILSGDTMFSMAFHHFLQQPHPRLLDILRCFNQTATEVGEGQQYDMNFEQREDVSIDEYLEMIRLKTAVLLAGALKIGSLYADAPDDDIEKTYQYGLHLGIAFQLQDDLLDAYGDTTVFGKKTGQDILDCKKTFLILKALEKASNSQRTMLHERFSKQCSLSDSQKINDVLSIYGDLGIKTLVEETIDNEFKQAEAALDAVNVTESAKSTLRQLNREMLHREK